MDIEEKKYLIEKITRDLRRYNLEVERNLNEIEHLNNLIKKGKKHIIQIQREIEVYDQTK